MGRPGALLLPSFASGAPVLPWADKEARTVPACLQNPTFAIMAATTLAYANIARPSPFETCVYTILASAEAMLAIAFTLCGRPRMVVHSALCCNMGLRQVPWGTEAKAAKEKEPTPALIPFWRPHNLHSFRLN